jgi:glyoxylase-like metal-dependent hydrolase (beta-lactamase superfamily II)
MATMATDRRRVLAGLAGLASLPFAGAWADTRHGAAGHSVTASGAPAVERLTDRISLITGAPGNLVVHSAGDGLVMVDSGSPAQASAVFEKLGGATVRTLINTHYHADQTGGNALLAHAGAEIRAHAVTRQWLAADYYVPAEDRWVKAPPAEAVPTRTFREHDEMTAGGERIEFGYLFAAHTFGDIYVYFRDANVLAVGDVASPLVDPVHDWYAGGWLGGRVDALDVLLALAGEETLIVPAYGAVMTRAELASERDMMLHLYDRTAHLTANGHSAQDMLDAGVLDEVSRTFQDPYRFLYDVAKGYQANYTNVGVNVV